mmetsp:Transcript_8511/g.24413  ORF Transcript_8511/g.24413 Transcript_8511/m.24413 type:complete len:205 (+) Transcript_8511:469-1083(+)
MIEAWGRARTPARAALQGRRRGSAKQAMPGERWRVHAGFAENVWAPISAVEYVEAVALQRGFRWGGEADGALRARRAGLRLAAGYGRAQVRHHAVHQARPHASGPVQLPESGLILLLQSVVLLSQLVGHCGNGELQPQLPATSGILLNGLTLAVQEGLKLRLRHSELVRLAGVWSANGARGNAQELRAETRAAGAGGAPFRERH